MLSFFLLGIEDLCSKRDEVQRQILLEEEEKRKIQNDIRILTERLAQVNESLAQKIATRADYDQTIAETEAAYKKVDYTFTVTVQVPLLIASSTPGVLGIDKTSTCIHKLCQPGIQNDTAYILILGY